MGETLTNLKAAAEALGNLARIDSMNSPGRKGLAMQGIEKVLLALNEFDACTRYLNTRRSSGAVINIESEADVQDVLYLLLRPWIVDLKYESPGDKSANRYVIKDFLSPAEKFVIDAKYIRDADHGRAISKELHDDIEMYRKHPNCDDLVFFIYDPDGLIPDQRALREAIEVGRAYGENAEKRLRCHLIVKP
jgi:REase_DpnII-MboI